MRPRWKAGMAGLMTTTLAIGLLGACTPAAPSTGGNPGTEASSTPGTGSTAPATAGDTAPAETPAESPGTETPQPSKAEQALGELSLEQRVGQVLMVGFEATGARRSTLEMLEERNVGNLFLKGRSKLGAAGTRKVVDTALDHADTNGIRSFVSTDQEGGAVQVLSGPGFSVMPSGLVQGGWSASRLEAEAEDWADELAGAGIDVNLAPVADTVPSAAAARTNAPIGYFGRQFGFTTDVVASHSKAFTRGMEAGGVASVVKHFPGLGRVTANTDTTANVVDTVTTRKDPYLLPFAENIEAGNQWVMVSNARYQLIDPVNIAPFSAEIMQGMLRKDQGFEGIIISDDMCAAVALSPWSHATRAKKFFNAGGTMMLCVEADAVPEISRALVAEAKKSSAFRAKIDAAALIVLETKLG